MLYMSQQLHYHDRLHVRTTICYNARDILYVTTTILQCYVVYVTTTVFQRYVTGHNNYVKIIAICCIPK